MGRRPRPRVSSAAVCLLPGVDHPPRPVSMGQVAVAEAAEVAAAEVAAAEVVAAEVAAAGR